MFFLFLSLLDTENQPDWGDPEGAAAAQCGCGRGERHPDWGGRQSHRRSAGAAGGHRAAGQNLWTSQGQGQSIRQTHCHHHISIIILKHICLMFYTSVHRIVNMMNTSKSIGIWFYVFFLYIHARWLSGGFIAANQCSFFSSLLIKSFLSCLQISGSEEQEERILNLQNDLKTSIVVSSDSKTLKTDVSLNIH